MTLEKKYTITPKEQLIYSIDWCNRYKIPYIDITDEQSITKSIFNNKK